MLWDEIFFPMIHIHLLFRVKQISISLFSQYQSIKNDELDWLENQVKLPYDHSFLAFHHLLH